MILFIGEYIFNEINFSISTPEIIINNGNWESLKSTHALINYCDFSKKKDCTLNKKNYFVAISGNPVISAHQNTKKISLKKSAKL